MSYIALANITLTSTDSEVVFGNLPTGYTDYILVANVRSSNQSGVFAQCRIRINNVSTSSYSFVNMDGGGSGATSSSNGSAPDIEMGLMAGTGDATGVYSNVIAHFFDPKQTDKHKTVLIRNDHASANSRAVAGRYASTDAISSIQVRDAIGSFAIGSTFALYGVAG
jgi:hypothetical protein